MQGSEPSIDAGGGDDNLPPAGEVAALPALLLLRDLLSPPLCPLRSLITMRNSSTSLVLSVFPAPDSPLTMIDWSDHVERSAVYAASAMR